MRVAPQTRAGSIELSEQMPRSIVKPTDRPSVNPDAFRVFYSRTNRPLWAYLLRVSGRRDVADDLLQETYCRFLAAELPEMDSSQSRSYLFRIATNLLRDRWRRGDVTAAISPTDHSYADDPEARTDVRRAFAQLKHRERQLLWLAYVEGFDHKEIAQLTGLSTGSIRVLLFRARRQLAGTLHKRPRNGSKG
jgi:RNA polymerase sigma-70 factor (ECF subfamily)